MVLETLLNARSAEHYPYLLFFLGVLCSSLGIVLSLVVFKSYASLVMLFLAVMMLDHLVYGTFEYEEHKDTVRTPEFSLLQEHGKAVFFLIFLFLGLTVSYTSWYVFADPATSDVLFKTQQSEIRAVNQRAQMLSTGSIVGSYPVLKLIVVNNLKVFFLCFLFSFLFSSGATFIITWNASVIGTAIGQYVKTHALSAGLWQSWTGGLVAYFTHGIPEILSYVMAGLIAGILSLAIVKRDLETDAFGEILKDVAVLTVIALSILVLAGLIEVYVTPMMYA